jgi:GDPmannose 4,6-dehydratase
MKKAIIFGITGQDGSHLSDLLLSKGYTVIGVYRRSSTSNLERIRHILDDKELCLRFNLIEGDISDSHSIIGILNKYADVDEVYNLAAQSHVATSFKQPALTWDITGKGCLNILQSIVDLKMQDRVRFYQASSSEMYGRNYDESTLSNHLVAKKYQNEQTRFMPQSPYAIAKCAAHYMTILFREAYGMHASSGILFNHEGPRRGGEFVTRKITRWIGEFVRWKKLHGEDLGYVYNIDRDYIHLSRNPGHLFGSSFPKLRLGNLDASRDWGYAGDYVEAMWLMLQQDKADDYVICTGETHTIREFLDAAFECVGIDSWENLVVQDPEFYRPAEVDFLRGDATKAKMQLGWTPKHSFEDLVKMMVEHEIR